MPGAGNIINWNQIGVSIYTSTKMDDVATYGSVPSDHNSVQGNFIGTDPTGSSSWATSGMAWMS